MQHASLMILWVCITGSRCQMIYLLTGIWVRSVCCKIQIWILLTELCKTTKLPWLLLCSVLYCIFIDDYNICWLSQIITLKIDDYVSFIHGIINLILLLATSDTCLLVSVFPYVLKIYFTAKLFLFLIYFPYLYTIYICWDFVE